MDMKTEKLFTTKLTENELQRYSRQFIIQEIGSSGQIKIREAKILICGLGGLGSPALMYLSSCGVQKIGIVDHDKVEIHNLQRQIIHSEKFIGKYKTESAVEYIKGYNSSIHVEAFNDKIDSQSIEVIAKDYDYILDCTDNIDARYIISDYCTNNNKSMVLGSVLRFNGQIFVLPKGAPCYRCLFKDMKIESGGCGVLGVLGPACGIIGSIMATETIKMIISEPKAYLLIYDAMEGTCRRVKLREKDANCASRDASVIVVPPERITNNENQPASLISWKEYFGKREDYVLVDVSPRHLYDIITISGAISIPLSELRSADKNQFTKKVACFCRKGITSLKAQKIFEEMHVDSCAIDGGLMKFKADVDTDFPL